MNTDSNQLWNKLFQISERTRQKLLSKGLALPKENPDGSVSFNKYTVSKAKDGTFMIKQGDTEICKDINLAQTALLLANDLALGRHLDQKLIDKDRSFGYAEFEEELYRRSSETDDIKLIKFQQSQDKKLTIYSEIAHSFEKLRRIV